MTIPGALRQISLVDVREGGALRHAVEGSERCRALRDDCLTIFPRAAAPLIPLLDRIARRWLSRSQSPYVKEIEAIAAALGFSGVWLLNGAYQWGCTARAHEENGLPWLARTLDWPFPGLGRHVEVAHKSGPAGDFYSVTWPGYVGTLTAMAPQRFAASINQAPLRRRTRRPWLRPLDIAANALGTWALRYVPPDQLLRQVFETCRNFDEARRMLETTPIARPVIFTLTGCAAGEVCVIERTEEDFSTREIETSVANDWHNPQRSWEGRVGSDVVFTSTYEEAAAKSVARRDGLAGFQGSLTTGTFAWVTEPVLNRFTRMAVETCPAKGVLRVVGYDQVPGQELPARVTETLEIAPMRAAA
jgi:hypothetical protein